MPEYVQIQSHTMKHSVYVFIYLFIMSYLPRSTPSVCNTVLPGAPAPVCMYNKDGKNLVTK